MGFESFLQILSDERSGSGPVKRRGWSKKDAGSCFADSDLIGANGPSSIVGNIWV